MLLMALQLSLCILAVIYVMSAMCSMKVVPISSASSYKGPQLSSSSRCCRRIDRKLNVMMRKNRQLRKVVSGLKKKSNAVDKLSTKGEFKKPCRNIQFH